MSTILKALKKLEERKASEGRRQGDIAWDILRERPASVEHRASLTVWLAIGLAAIVFAAAVLYFLARDQQDSWLEPSASEDSRPALNEITVRTSVVDSTPAQVAARESQATSSPPEQTVPEAEMVELPGDVSLTVSGIAYHENDAARIAIVNDLPVMVGTVIEGMVVERIEQQRVVFSREGKLIAVFLNVAN